MDRDKILVLESNRALVIGLKVCGCYSVWSEKVCSCPENRFSKHFQL